MSSVKCLPLTKINNKNVNFLYGSEKLFGQFEIIRFQVLLVHIYYIKVTVCPSRILSLKFSRYNKSDFGR
jgi:hypothetical protein